MGLDQLIEAIHGVEWSRYKGAYDRDYPVGEFLADVASPDLATAHDAMGRVLAHVCHQDMLEEAAEPVFPLLFSMLGVPNAHQWVALKGVATIQSAAWTSTSHFGFKPRNYGFAGAIPPGGLQDIVDQADRALLSERLQVVFDAKMHVMVPLLTDHDPRTRAYAARLLALTRRPDRALVSELAAAMKRETEEPVRCGLLLAMACLERDLRETDGREVARRVLSSPSAAERSCAVVALLLTHPERTFDEHSEAIVEALTHDSAFEFDLFPWDYGHVAGLAAEAVSMVPGREHEIAEILVASLKHWDQHPTEAFATEWLPEDLIGARLIDRVFRNHLGRRDFLTGGELSDVQRWVVGALGDSPRPLFAPEILDGYGFRDLHKDASRMLGREFGGLDQQMEGWWSSRWVQWPLWKWWHQALCADRWSATRSRRARDFVVATMRRNLPPACLFSAAQDAALGAYEVPHAPLVRAVAQVAERLHSELEEYTTSLGPEATGPQAALAVYPTFVLARTQPVPWLRRALELLERVEPKNLREEAEAMAHW